MNPGGPVHAGITLYKCRRCRALNSAWLTFETGGYYYCLHHIPWRSRLRMWLRRAS